MSDPASRATQPPRPRTIRARIISLLVVPVLALLALWGHAAVTCAQQVSQDRRALAVDTDVRAPVTALRAALQDERRAMAARLAEPGDGTGGALRTAIERTDAACAALTRGTSGTIADTGGFPPPVTERMDALLAEVTALADGRSRTVESTVDWPAAYAAYSGAVDSALRAEAALTADAARPAPELALAGEYLARQDALLLAASGQRALPAEQHAWFTAAAAGQRALWDAAAGALPARAGARWAALESGPAAELARLSATVTEAGPGSAAVAALPGDRWTAAHREVAPALADIEAAARRAAAPGSTGVVAVLRSPAGAAVLLGLAAVVAALLVSVRTGRALLTDLAGLRAQALDIARRKLPAAMRRLNAGREIDIAAEAPEQTPPGDEVGQVRQALGTVHRAALRAAAERAALSDGISRVFVHLARRSQLLINRQLAMLDEMERRTEDPDALEELFRLDHLTTRMRRQAESLIILSGSAPGRGWHEPVPMPSVVQAAVSEIEDYRRIEVRAMPDAALAGHFVADLTHLLAELLENATHFSPPHTWVRVTGAPADGGYLLRIRDAGLGMAPAELDRANHRIRRTEALDLFEADRLGLLVVGRLAARHDVSVSLHSAESEGVTASVLLPGRLLAPLDAGWPLAGNGAGRSA